MTEGAELHGLITGAETIGFLIAAVFFLRFWRRTGDALFLAFAAAFLVFGVAQPLPTLLGGSSEHRSPIYLLRLAGFLLIIWAILRKNFEHRRR
ncbi:MAG TPA: DUF5985 family protein [Caulobacteraceae bacterium]|nr:DUF5985 family protein [Caulobacteraceae bacterium]